LHPQIRHTIERVRAAADRPPHRAHRYGAKAPLAEARLIPAFKLGGDLVAPLVVGETPSRDSKGGVDGPGKLGLRHG
jgi:hypothetical protein